MYQEGLKFPTAQRRFNLLIGRKLMRIQCPRRALGGKHAGWRFRFESDQLAARQRSRGLASSLHRSFEFMQVVRPRMQFQEGMQLALPLGKLGVLQGAGQPGCAQARSGRTQRIALRFQVLDLDKTLLLERANDSCAIGELFLEIGSRKRPGFEQT